VPAVAAAIPTGAAACGLALTTSATAAPEVIDGRTGCGWPARSPNKKIASTATSTLTVRRSTTSTDAIWPLPSQLRTS
jgi:hypothetical protein